MERTMLVMSRANSAFKGIAAACLWYGTVFLAVVAVALIGQQNLLTTAGVMIPALVMVFLAYVTRDSKTWAPLGTSFTLSQWAFGTIAVFGVYAVGLIWTTVTSQPKEPFMALLYVGYTPLESVLFTLAVIVCAPIGEELAMRHFLMGDFLGKSE